MGLCWSELWRCTPIDSPVQKLKTVSIFLLMSWILTIRWTDEWYRSRDIICTEKFMHAIQLCLFNTLLCKDLATSQSALNSIGFHSALLWKWRDTSHSLPCTILSFSVLWHTIQWNNRASFRIPSYLRPNPSIDFTGMNWAQELAKGFSSLPTNIISWRHLRAIEFCTDNICHASQVSRYPAKIMFQPATTSMQTAIYHKEQ